jgi:hypothetical protein
MSKKLVQKPKAINWNIITNIRSNIVPSHCIGVTFHSSKKGSIIPNSVTFCIGEDLLNKMKWSEGDKICVYNDPDDIFHFMLTKSTSDNGYKIAKYQGSVTYRIKITWRNSVTLKPLKLTVFPHEIDGGNKLLVKVI